MVFFFLVSDLQLVQIMLAADDCRKKKYQNTKEKKKEGPPQTKGLKKQTNKKNQTHMARNGEDPIVLEAHGIYFSL